MDAFSRSDPQSLTAFPVAKPGYPFIFAFAFTTAVFALLELTFLSLVALAGTIFVACFFRDPDRVVPNSPGTVVAPADGKVISVETLEKTDYYSGSCKRVSIFMSVFNVHVNRIPFEGTIQKISYRPGKFIAANRDKASLDNERNAVYIEAENGRHITAVQIAGLVARRIICGVAEGDRVLRGQRFGMICFGSRVDLYLPSETDIKVEVGETVKAGTSSLGVMS